MDLLVGDAKDSRNGRPANINVHNSGLGGTDRAQRLSTCCIEAKWMVVDIIDTPESVRLQQVPRRAAR